jgi:monomeric sarcosine oxidase
MNYDVAVVGAGVFGAWIAYQLRARGCSVLLLDSYGPGNSRASSGGESRIMRLGYGPNYIYSRSAQTSGQRWHELFAQREHWSNLFQKTGLLWLARERDPYTQATLSVFNQLGVKHDLLDHDELRRRFPQLEPGLITWGILEHDAGVLMARRAVQAVVEQAQANGVDYYQEAITAPSPSNGKLSSIKTLSGSQFVADQFVFACGPWLPKLFPDLLGQLIHVSKQEVVFFGVPAGAENFRLGKLPIWIDFNDLVYCLPDLDGRGIKMAIDAHGPEFDPDSGERVVSAAGLKAAREHLAQRMPLMVNAPITETRVCQYENTSNGDLLIDRHPLIENVWLAGGGSGHGFKHGPMVGEYVAGMIYGEGQTEPRFSLATKGKVHERTVY